METVVCYKQKYVYEVLVNCLVWVCPEKKVLLADCLNMTIAIDWDHKPNKKILKGLVDCILLNFYPKDYYYDQVQLSAREGSGSVVDCLTRGRGAVG